MFQRCRGQTIDSAWPRPSSMMAWRCRQMFREQLDAVALVHQNAAVVFMGERMEVALIGHHQLVANIAGARCEAGLALLARSASSK